MVCSPAVRLFSTSGELQGRATPSTWHVNVAGRVAANSNRAVRSSVRGRGLARMYVVGRRVSTLNANGLTGPTTPERLVDRASNT